MEDEKITSELSELIEKGEELRERLKSRNKITDRYEDRARRSNLKLEPKVSEWSKRAKNLLKLRFGKNSEYLQDFLDELSLTLNKEGGRFYEENVGNANGVLKTVYNALDKGLTEDLFYKKEIRVFSDLLDQAYELLDKELRIGAAIYGRIVLETTIKEYARKEGIEEVNNKDVSDAKFDQVIIELRKKECIKHSLEDSLRANYRIGSYAAHGDEEFEDYSDSEIREYLNFIRDKILTL